MLFTILGILVLAYLGAGLVLGWILWAAFDRDPSLWQRIKVALIWPWYLI